MKTKRAFARFTTTVELMGFLWERKLWWMIPMVLILVLFGGLMIFAQTSPLAPLLYPLF